MKSIGQIILLFFTLSTFGQNDNSWRLTEKRPTKGYLTFLSRDSTNENYMFTFGIKYQYTLKSNSFNTNGFYVTGGFNLARFFSRKIVLGGFVDLAIKKNLFYDDIASSGFVTDFNNSFNTSYTSQQDSAIAYEFKQDVNDRRFGSGTYALCGIMFSPFPNRYGGILLSFKYGFSSHWTGPVYGNKFINNGEADHLYFDSEIYTYEITIKPFCFVKNPAKRFDKGKHFIQRVSSISFSYDNFVIKNMEVYGVKLSQMVNNSFMNKYGTTNRFIISLGLTLY